MKTCFIDPIDLTPDQRPQVWFAKEFHGEAIHYRRVPLGYDGTYEQKFESIGLSPEREFAVFVRTE